MANLFAETGIGKHIIRTHHWGIVLPNKEKADAFMNLFGLQEDYRGHVVPYDSDLIFTKRGDGADSMEVPVKKYFRLFPGNEVRFKGAYFITCNEVVKNEDGSIKELLCTYDPETRSGSGFEGRKVKGTIHWVDAKTAVKVKIRNYNHLMIPNEEGENVLNPDSVEETFGYAEPAIADAQPGERFQFFRHGYYIADSKLTTDEEKVFNRIVDLKSSWKPGK